MTTIDPIQRIRRVGALSLLSLLAGSVIILFVGTNILRVNPTQSTVLNHKQHASPFYIGSSLSLQFWLALIGVGFGCLAYGFSETWVHFFDATCSRLAASEHGLDYARYLNSQPRAPVLYGWRGFWWMTTLRYLVIALGIVASVGYKFTVFYVPSMETENLDPTALRLSTPSLTGMVNGTLSPWFSDYPGNIDNRAFVHTFGTKESLYSPPESIIMASLSRCDDVFSAIDKGVFVHRELVMVANATDETDLNGPHYMTSNHTGWMRIRAPSRHWTSLGSKKRVIDEAIVDYKINAPGSILIQWTGFFPKWDSCDFNVATCDATKYRVAARVRYDMHYAVAEVGRWVEAGDCSHIPDHDSDNTDLRYIQILSNDKGPIKTVYSDGSLTLFRNWVDAIIYDIESNSRNGVSAFVRAVMAGWGSEPVDESGAPKLGALNAGQVPYSPEIRGKYTSSFPEFRYPFYYGNRGSKRTGGSEVAAKVFLAVGCFGLLVFVIRICIGPPNLTSWMGQHVALARNGGFGTSMTYGMADGYTSARGNTEYLRLIHDGIGPGTWRAFYQSAPDWELNDHAQPVMVEEISMMGGK